MNQIIIGFRKMKTLEKVFLVLTFLSVVLKHIFDFKETIDIFVFGMVLGILYFPLGFYYLGKPSINYSIIVSIIFGFIYAAGVVSFIMGTFKIDGYEFPLAIVFLFLLAITVFLLFKLKSSSYSKEYIYAQFLRISFVVLTNLIVLLLKK